MLPISEELRNINGKLEMTNACLERTEEKVELMNERLVETEKNREVLNDKMESAEKQMNILTEGIDVIRLKQDWTNKELNEFKFNTSVFEHAMRKDVRMLQDTQETLITALEHHKMLPAMS